MFPFCAETSLKRCNHKKFLPDVGVQTWLVGTPLAHRHTWCRLVCLLSSSCTGSSLGLRTTWRSRRRRFTSTAQNRSISSIQISESSTCNRRHRLAYSNSSHFPCFLFSLKRSTFLQTTLHFPLLLLVVCTGPFTPVPHPKPCHTSSSAAPRTRLPLFSDSLSPCFPLQSSLPLSTVPTHWPLLASSHAAVMLFTHQFQHSSHHIPHLLAAIVVVCFLHNGLSCWSQGN